MNQGYHSFFDNFYTSVQLLGDLIGKGIRIRGTIIANRKCFPAQLMDVKIFEKQTKTTTIKQGRYQMG